ncbi:hypothetical protein AB0O69_22955 [Streptomyces xiamenensis]|uniref:hypothetical protein n=1 Tax=Streptomyces xiamenensis TaxID=408015 RepID=UPI003440EE4C
MHTANPERVGDGEEPDEAEELPTEDDDHAELREKVRHINASSETGLGIKSGGRALGGGVR